MKNIVVFYSYEGNTLLIAENIAHSLGADIIEVKPEKEMKSKGIMKFVWGGRQAVMGTKPTLKEIKRDLDSYDLFIIGTPVWAGRPTPPIKAFMEDHLPPNKKLAFFITHDGGEGSTFAKMREMANGGKVISTKDFMSPLKGDRGKIIGEVLTWASGLKEE